jgi:uncharacterized damage-inducible protein DinB
VSGLPDTRIDPPLRADPAATLVGFLDFHRATLRWKTADLDADGLRASLAPSTLTAAGMLKHLAYVESMWCSVVLRGEAIIEPFGDVDWAADPDWDWHSALNDDPAVLRAGWEASVAASDAILADALASDEGLALLSVREDRHGGGAFSLGWILVHLVEEYARHNGHLDLVRESIDGFVGE